MFPLRQCGNCNVSQIANIHGADTCAGGRGKESALFSNGLLEIQQALHEKIRAQKCKREAGVLYRRFNHTVVAKKPLRRIRVCWSCDNFTMCRTPHSCATRTKSICCCSARSVLDPVFGLQLNDANAIAEKIEGLAWGPDLADGRHVLYVISDNDLNPLAARRFSPSPLALLYLTLKRNSS